MHQQRTIRVFISSTFRDMKAERDYLVKFIFSQLRKFCNERQVVWGEVDLRWGVTDEQAAEGKVLPICLEEIRRCRPYFIGLLGERYGWIPDTIPPDVIDREPWLKEHLHGHKSVTELEILHGVLNDPDMSNHAFFYFRDPEYLNRLPQGSNLADFVSETPEAAKGLVDLKERIRRSGFLVHEDYPDPKALGEMVLNDLTAVIEQLFPKGSEPDPLDKEAAEHEAYAQSRRGVYVGREEYFDRLDAHAEASDDKPLVVLGESGSGKSAALANWVVRYRERHPEAVILQHYIGATPFSSDWAQMVRRLMAELKRKFDLPQEIPDKPEELRTAFPNWLYMAAAKGRIVLVLDALNQLEDRDGAPDLVWLPPVIPENVRLIVATLPGRPLEEVKKRDWPMMEVQPLDDSERRRLLKDFLAQYARNLETRRVDQIVTAKQTANPLYLRVLLDELRQFGEYERLQERIDYYLGAKSVAELYARVIARWDEDYSAGIDLVKQSLSLLWAARRGLSESELLEILGTDGQPLPRAIWSPLFLAMADALASRSGLLNFTHDFLRQATQQVCAPAEEAQHGAHIRLADYFEKQSMSLRRTDEMPWQLYAGAAWQRLYDLLSEPEFFKACWAQNQFDAKSYWASIEASSALRMTAAYQALIAHPEQEPDTSFLWLVGILLGDSDHPDEALVIRCSLSEHYKALGDQDNLQASLGNQALSLKSRGDIDGAMALHKEQELICRQLGNLDGLAISLANQSVILAKTGMLTQSLSAVGEAFSLASSHGLLALATQIEPILNAIRKAERESGA